ncbi:MAG: RES family NAD+ phosphorylase [Legionella sp.]|uniref:RES family NAD+ phosphorylase n=1 Tax=Legionella sp. TaxID=459 RepID=UPI0039E6AE9E
MNAWDLCKNNELIKPLTAEPWRVVEAQHILSARDLVDNREEHDLLEELLEESKPLIEKEKNYLIFTPFRYPPLKYGSRFGRICEPSLWYGSLKLETAFNEVAYYRFKFLKDTQADLGYLEISMTAFTAYLSTGRGIDLTEAPFHEYLDQITNKEVYEYSQMLGTSMREQQIEAFLYPCARSKKTATNVAAYTPTVFKMKGNRYINNQQTWICLANKQVIEFTRIGILGKERYSFTESYFH